MKFIRLLLNLKTMFKKSLNLQFVLTKVCHFSGSSSALVKSKYLIKVRFETRSTASATIFSFYVYNYLNFSKINLFWLKYLKITFNFVNSMKITVDIFVFGKNIIYMIDKYDQTFIIWFEIYVNLKNINSIE